MNWAIHQDGHQWAYDLQSLTQLASDAIDDGGKLSASVEPLSPEDPWNTRPGLECGIVITKAVPAAEKAAAE